MKNRKEKFAAFATLTLLAVASVPLFFNSDNEPVEVANAYSASSLPTTIDLNDTSAANIRSYYSSLNSLATEQRQGTNLLKNLKTILKNGQKYYSYDSGNAIWQIYEITDRDWAKSPASSTTYGTYNSSTNKITGYTYGTSNSSSKNNPYIHALYINRDVTNETRAWGNHNQDQWGINREHVWPKAEGFDSTGAGGARGDPMHLMAGNGYANNIHSNYYYGYVKTSSSYTDCGSTYSNQSGNLRGTSKTLNTGTVFEPQDCDKGDIARAIFYMVARYNYLSGSDSDGIDSNNPNLALTQSISDWSNNGYSSTTSKTGKMGILTDLLNWHHQDPVDEYEIHRNNLLYTNYTNNRNPFIDFPEWADFIWGTATYNGTSYQSYNSNPTGYATPSSDTINGYNGGSSDPVSVTGVTLEKESTSIEVGASEVLSATVSPSNATNKGLSWTSSNTSVATVSDGGRVIGVSEGSATITVKTSDGEFTDTCSVTITAASGGGEGTEEDSVTAASGALPGWTASGTGTAYADGSVRFDGAGDNVYKTDLFSGNISSGMTSLTVTINGKINGTPTAANSYKVEALDSSGNVLASDVKTGADIVTTSYGDATFTIDSGLEGCTGIKITYVTKGGGNWGVKSVSWTVTYSTGSEEATLSSIAVKNAPTKLTYTAGDGFDANGLVITATYSDSTTADISYVGNEDAFEFDPADNLQTSDVSVTITYGGKTCSQAITVNAAKTLSSITLNTDNVTKTFYVDDLFEHDNLVVTAHFSDSSSEVVSSSATISSPDMSTAGEKTITVSYTYGGTQKSASYTITILENGGSQTGSFTWDLSIASYNTPTSASLVTWSSDCATLTAEQATGKTAANNYLGGDANARTSSRFYTGNTMRFAPAENYEITSVVFTATQASYATALSGSTWTNATAAVSNSTTVTITPTDGTSQFYAVLTGTTGGTSIVVNYSYTPPASLSSISWTAPTINVYSGATLSGENVNAWAVTYNDGAGHQTVLTYNQLTVKLGGTTISIPHIWSADDDGKTLTATYNGLTTSASSAVKVTQSLQAIMANETSDWSHTIGSKTWSAYDAQTINGKSWTAAVPNSDGDNFGYDGTKGQQFGKAADPCTVLTLSSSAFSGTIKTIKVTTSGASSVVATLSVKVGDSDFTSGGNKSVSISATSTEYTFTGSGSGEIVITWTNNSAKALYVKGLAVSSESGLSNIANVTGHEDAQRAVVKFAKAFNAAMDTTDGCTTNMSSAWSSATSAWNTFLSEAAALGSTEEAYAKSLIANATSQWTSGTDSDFRYCLERALATYDRCVSVHGQTAFMSDVRSVSSGYRVSPLSVINSKSVNTSIVIVSIAIACAASIGAYFILRKRKEDK